MKRDTFDGVSRYTEKVAETLAVVNDRVGKIEAITTNEVKRELPLLL